VRAVVSQKLDEIMAARDLTLDADALAVLNSVS